MYLQFPYDINNKFILTYLYIYLLANQRSIMGPNRDYHKLRLAHPTQGAEC